MSSCQDIQGLLSRYVDHELSAADVNRVDSHLSVCDKCAEDLRLMEREAELFREALKADDVPAHIGVGVWDRMRRARLRRTNYWWYAAATAASVLVALIIGVVSRPVPPVAQLAQVTTCAGPLEIRTARRDWAPLATYAMLQDGDRIRCGVGKPGTLILNETRRLDLNYDTEVAFFRSGDYGRFRMEMRHGHIRAHFPRIRQPVSIRTPVANVWVTPEEKDAAGEADFEMRLTGIEPEIGLLGRIHLLPAAYAGGNRPQLEILVHKGSVSVENATRHTISLKTGERVTVAAEGPILAAAQFDIAARRDWRNELAPTVASVPDPLPVPEIPGKIAREPVRREDLPDPGKGVEPGPKPPERKPGDIPRESPHIPRHKLPPAPAGLTAAPDIHSVLLTWDPVIGTKRPIVEYGIYRRAPGDNVFGLAGRLEVQGKPKGKCMFRDDGLSIGVQYVYAVTAAYDHEGGLVEGPVSAAVTASAGFHIYYTGYSGDLAMVAVEKMHEGKIVRHTFHVRPRDLRKAASRTGDIGGVRDVFVEPIRGTWQRVAVDFSTGYHLVDIVTKIEHPRGIPRRRSKIIIENEAGLRREIPQIEPPK